MSAAAITKSSAIWTAPAGAIVRRFVWKEIRTLRPLWLATAVLAVLIQCLLNVLSPPSALGAQILFATAFSAAVLYAVAAAAATFSMEHEDQTYDFLTVLPLTWRPIFVGKLIVVAVSTIALAAVLTIAGWSLRGFETPSAQDARVVAGVLGVAMLEAIAWGVLFSLLVKRPMAAAILALVVAGASANLALILSSSRSSSNFISLAYVEAIPLRLAFVVVALGLSAIVARRWLPSCVATAPSERSSWLARWRTVRKSIAQQSSPTAPSSARGERRRILARLLWQTWREGRKMLLVPIVVTTVLVLMIAVVVTLTRGAGFSSVGDKYRLAAWLSASLFLPALYGALAFSADQRRRSYRFLAEHAAPPRYVWLARHTVWLGTVIILAFAIRLIGATLGIRLFAEVVSEEFTWSLVSTRESQRELSRGVQYLIAATALAWQGTLSAYAVGQLCSMLLRSEILAAFLALIASVFVTAWCAVCFAWQLSGWFFVLPVAVASLLATWLRAPDWIAGRNSLRAWLKLVLVLIAPFVVVGLALPAVRLAQLDTPARPLPSHFMSLSPSEVPGDIKSITAAYRAPDTPEARETAAMYERAAAALDSWHDSDPLEPWQKPQYAKDDNPAQVDEAKIPTDQFDAYQKAQQQHQERIEESKATAIKLAIEASQRPDCYFDFNGDASSHHPLYAKLLDLLRVMAPSEEHVAFDPLLAAVRMTAHLRMGQPADIFGFQLDRENMILQQIGEWAGKENRTDEELADAFEKLTLSFRSWPSLQASLIADHKSVRDVLTGEGTSWVLSQKNVSPRDYLAYVANQLPWEQERSLRALDLITRYNVADAARLDSVIHLQPGGAGRSLIRHFLRPAYEADWPERWAIAHPDAATSYLVRFEYEARLTVDQLFRSYAENAMCRRGVLLQIALVRYRRDHGAYPMSLSELAPEYFADLPLDPFSQQAFEYRPQGLDLPLRALSRSNFQRIDAKTPLLWSTTTRDAHLAQWEFTDLDENDPNATDYVRETAYTLSGDEPPWWNDPVFVFTLPK